MIDTKTKDVVLNFEKTLKKIFSSKISSDLAFQNKHTKTLASVVIININIDKCMPMAF
jgi:hypothetical protein